MDRQLDLFAVNLQYRGFTICHIIPFLQSGRRRGCRANRRWSDGLRPRRVPKPGECFFPAKDEHHIEYAW